MSGPTFDTIDWERHEPSRAVVDRRTLAFGIALAGLLAVFLYDLLVVPSGLILFGWFSPSVLDWLAALAGVLIVFYVIVPLVRDRAVTVRYWRRLRQKPGAMASLAFLSVIGLFALVGPEVWGPPRFAPLFASLSFRGSTPPVTPPVGTVVPLSLCAVERVAGGCVGTWIHPLGTDGSRDVLAVVMEGARFSVLVAAITAAILVPLGTAVGVVAGYLGGRVEVVIVRYLDLQGTLPAFLVYFLYQFLYGPETIALVALFGFLGWDRVARRVRTDTLRLREAGFVRAAKAAGTGPVGVMRRHIVPNVSASVVSALTVQLPYILLMEATFSFLGIVGLDRVTWGKEIALGLQTVESGIGLWWIYTFPAIALIGTIIALATLGNALYDTFETRREAT